jgi:hypothetical protein
MDTHDQENKASSPNDSSSVFRGGPVMQGEKRDSNPTADPGDSNPYRFGQSTQRDFTKGQSETNPADKGPGIFQQIKSKLFKEEPGENNTRQKVMVILIPILFIIMIFMFRQVLSKSPQETEGATNDDSQVVTPVDSGGEIDWRIPEPIPMTIRDPIKPGTKTVVPDTGHGDSNNLETLSVRGILFSKDKPSAVIGNKIVHLNEKINGATLVQIDRDFVVFEKDGKRWTKKVAELQTDWEQWQQKKPKQNVETNKIH